MQKDRSPHPRRTTPESFRRKTKMKKIRTRNFQRRTMISDGCPRLTLLSLVALVLQSDFCLPAPRPRTCQPLQEARADQSRLLVAKETRLEERGRQGSRTKGGEVRESLLLEVVSISIYATKEHSSFGIFFTVELPGYNMHSFIFG